MIWKGTPKVSIDVNLNNQGNFYIVSRHYSS